MDERRIMEEKVFSFIEENHMLKAGDRVVAGVSGGADSVCLLFVLLSLAERMPLSIAVVHVNHGIRAEAGDDARYVEELCSRYNLPFYLTEEKIEEKALLWKCSQEEAGRRVRYEAFERAAESFGADRIAVAHNSNDRSETMLFHLFRGSGIKGLGSIQPVRDKIIRPILCLERKEIETYLKARGLTYCMDVTNDMDDYTRNRIRHHILPYVEKEIAPGCVAHMAQAAQLLSETESYLQEQTEAAIASCVEIQNKAGGICPNVNNGSAAEVCAEAYSGGDSAGRFVINIELLNKQHNVIRQRVLFSLAKRLSPHAKDISYVHIMDLMTLLTAQGSRMICLPFGIRGRRQYDKMILECIKEDSSDILTDEVLLDESDLKRTLSHNFETSPLQISGRWGILEFRILKNSSAKYKEVPQNMCTKWFDYDKIKQSLKIRTRQTGDYLSIADREGKLIHQSLKDYMISHKIPRQERDIIPVLADGQHVMWLVGYRISEYYKISENTKHILQVQLLSSCESCKTEDEDGGTC